MIPTLPITKKNQGYFLATIIALFSIVFLASCNKNDDNNAAPAPAVGYIKFVHSLPGYTSLDFYVGNQLITSPALLFGQSSSYGGFYTGTGTFTVVTGGTLQGLASTNITIAQDKYYSLYATRKSTTNDSVSTLLIEDNHANPTAGKVKVRFINLNSDNAAALDLAVQGGATLFTNKAFNTYTDFTEIDPGTYVFQAKDTGTSTVKASSASFTAAAGKIYTIWTRGLVSGTGNNALSVQIITEN